MVDTNRSSPSGIVDTKLVDTVSTDVPSIAANTGILQVLAVPGAEVGDMAEVQPLGTWLAGLTAGPAQCKVADQVLLPIANATAGALDLAAQQFRVKLCKLRPPA